MDDSQPTSRARFAYNGLNAIAEYDGSNALHLRFVHGPGVDESSVQYVGSGTSNRRWLHADERGSILAQRQHLALDANRSNHSIDELDAQLSWRHHIDTGLLKVR